MQIEVFDMLLKNQTVLLKVNMKNGNPKNKITVLSLTTTVIQS